MLTSARPFTRLFHPSNLNYTRFFHHSTLLQKMASGRAIKVAAPGGPEVMKVENVEFAKPSGTQVLIKASYSGVNFIE